MTILFRRGVLAALAALVVAAPAAADDAAVARGKLVATAAGCAVCHTAPGGAPYAGGLSIGTPFGPLVTPNITPDGTTGIGRWSADDLANALQNGLKPDGTPLYPAMPYTHFTRMTDGDVAALHAYLGTLEPVENRVEVNRLRFPFDIRDSLYVWRALYFTPGRFEPDPAKDAVWNRGAYLVEALSHCAMCHTPRDALGGPIESRAMQGGRVDEWYAPDISNGPDSVIADWSVERLERFLAGDSASNHVAVGSMRDVVGELAAIDRADVHAIAVYLKDQRPHEAAAPAKVAMSAEAKSRAGQLFADQCVSCHGTDGTGAPGVAASLVGSGGVLAAEPVNVVSVLLEGIGPNDRYGVMPSFRDALGDEAIAELANYVRTAWGNDASANATPEMVAGLRLATATAPDVATGAMCPNVPIARVDEAMRRRIADLAAAGTPDSAAVAALVAAYEAANPSATLTDRVVDLGGVFCDAVAETGAGRAAVTARELAFMDAVSAAPLR